MKGLTIRRAEEGEIERLYAIGLTTPELAVSDRFPFSLRADFEACCRDPEKGVVLVAAEAGEILGYAFVTFDVGGEAACLTFLVVLPERRGQGIGSRLFAAATDALLARGVRWLGLFARPSAAAFFLGRGCLPGHGYLWMDLPLDARGGGEAGA